MCQIGGQWSSHKLQGGYKFQRRGPIFLVHGLLLSPSQVLGSVDLKKKSHD